MCYSLPIPWLNGICLKCKDLVLIPPWIRFQRDKPLEPARLPSCQYYYCLLFTLKFENFHLLYFLGYLRQQCISAVSLRDFRLVWLLWSLWSICLPGGTSILNNWQRKYEGKMSVELKPKNGNSKRTKIFSPISCCRVGAWCVWGGCW